MMQLTIRKTQFNDANGISRWTQTQQPMFDAIADWDSEWPGVKQWNVWFNDTIFGRYRNLADLHEMEVEEVEEETEEHMDATALSEHEELEALIQPVSSGNGSDDSTGCDEGQQPANTGEGASVEADHSEPEQQADSDNGSDVSSDDLETEHECVDGAAATKRPALPLINITVRS